MASEKFIKGFRYELANRAFAFMAVERMVERLRGDERVLFWRSYLDLEVFNRPRYEAAAREWGLDVNPGILTKLKAWGIASVPKIFLDLLLRLVCSETVKYMDRLRDLSREGPADAKAFLGYMLAQEEMQIEMMRMALQGRYSEISNFAAEFFREYHDLGFLPAGDAAVSSSSS